MPSTTTRAARLGAAALCAGFSTACDNKPTEPVDFATLTLVTETTGDTLDVDGYILDVAGESVQVSANGTQVIDRLEPGAVSVDITGVAVNCSLSGNETRSVTIGTGLNQLRIEVVCRPALMPDWAPDGSRIAFYSSPDGSNSDIFVVNPDGSGLTQLTFTDGQDLYPKWSHDGTKLVFAHFLDGQYQLHTVNADGTGLLRLTNHSEFDLYPSWSPDDTRLVFSRQLGTEYHLFTVDADGSDVARLTTSTASDMGAEPHLSPGVREVEAGRREIGRCQQESRSA